MKLVPLDSVVEILDNKRIPINSTERAKRLGSVPYYGATGQVGTIDEAIFNETLVLLGEDGVPFFDSTKHKAYEISGPAWVNNHAHVLRAKSDQIIQRYLLHFLNSFNYSGYVNGATRLKLTQGDMKRIPIPLPSLEKQREIVEKLDSAFAEIDLLEENIGFRSAGADNLKSSFLSSFFEIDEFKESGNDYSFHSLGSVSLVKGGKRLPKGTKWATSPTKYPYIRVTDMKHGRVNEENLVFVPDEIRPLIKNYTVNTGDLIISIAGTIGEVAVVPDSLNNASLTENAAKIVLQKDKLDSEYCSYFLRSYVCRREIDSLVRTTTQPKLALFRIESLRIPIPSLTKQREIVDKLDDVFAEIDSLKLQLKKEMAHASSLRRSLLSSAFIREEAIA
jgi:type I restriction enzyme S subunit